MELVALTDHLEASREGSRRTDSVPEGPEAQLAHATGEGESGTGAERARVVVLNLLVGAARRAGASAGQAFEAAIHRNPLKDERIAARQRRFDTLPLDAGRIGVG